MSVSHDFGATWTQSKFVDSTRYFSAYDATVLPNGTVILSEAHRLLGAARRGRGNVEQRAFVSSNNGATWTNVLVDSVPIGEPCVAAGCGSDFSLGHGNVSADANGNPVYVYDGATVNQGPQQIWARRSTNGGHLERA